VLLLGTVGVAAWGVFLTYAANQERLSSSITQQVVTNLRDSSEVREVLGDAIRPEPVWYLNGDPWVDGVVSVAFLHVPVRDSAFLDQYVSRQC
jgi:cytochrome c oxidase assembly factor 1